MLLNHRYVSKMKYRCRKCAIFFMNNVKHMYQDIIQVNPFLPVTNNVH
jgi:hypothetical protein